MSHTPSKFQIHFTNSNGIRSRKAELEANLPRFPHSAFLAFVEAKIPHINSTPNLAKHGFVPFSFPFTDSCSGVVCYSSVACRTMKQLCFTAHEGSMILFHQLRIGTLSFLCGCAYIRPKASVEVVVQM